MSGALDQDQPLFSRAGVIRRLRHGAGDKPVAGAVDEEDGQLCMGDGLGRRDLPQAEAAEQPGKNAVPVWIL